MALQRQVVAVEGDSGFGFSLAELEVCTRYRLPITFVIINNNGIGGSPQKLAPTSAERLKTHGVTGLTPNCRWVCMPSRRLARPPARPRARPRARPPVCPPVRPPARLRRHRPLQSLARRSN
jgi:hypothetical protein